MAMGDPFKHVQFPGPQSNGPNAEFVRALLERSKGEKKKRKKMTNGKYFSNDGFEIVLGFNEDGDFTLHWFDRNNKEFPLKYQGGYKLIKELAEFIAGEVAVQRVKEVGRENK